MTLRIGGLYCRGSKGNQPCSCHRLHAKRHCILRTVHLCRSPLHQPSFQVCPVDTGPGVPEITTIYCILVRRLLHFAHLGSEFQYVKGEKRLQLAQHTSTTWQPGFRILYCPRRHMAGVLISALQRAPRC